jgi:hypothetical protein
MESLSGIVFTRGWEIAIYNDNQYQYLERFKANSTRLHTPLNPPFLCQIVSAKPSANQCQTERAATIGAMYKG